jgi:hypothetical protein
MSANPFPTVAGLEQAAPAGSDFPNGGKELRAWSCVTIM